MGLENERSDILKAIVRALDSPLSHFLNTEEDNQRLKTIKLILKYRESR
jgi:hypothetical protein